MKKYLGYSFAYAIAAMVGGVFYREFTKWNGFSGVTALGKVHTHLFLLGMMVFLFVALFASQGNLQEQKPFRFFMGLYNTGLPLMTAMLLVRGIPQVLGISLSAGVNAAISRVAGIGHILVGAGLILLFVSLRKAAKN